MMESENHEVATKKTRKQKRFHISSRVARAKEFGELVRGHWSMENGCLWVLHTLYREDHSQVRIAKAVKNFAILRRVAHNLLKSDQQEIPADETDESHGQRRSPQPPPLPG